MPYPMSPKYPRTFHLPWSPGGTSDDRRLQNVREFLNRDLVLTEKMDGSNVCLEADAVYARSHSNTPKHSSFSVLKSYHASVKHMIPEDTQVFGEWLYARHSIEYSGLPNYLMVFGVRYLSSGTWAAWKHVKLWANALGVPTVPVLKEGRFENEKALRKAVESLASEPGEYGLREGVVCRWHLNFPDRLFESAVGKWVRSGHVQTDNHWSHQEVVKNGLAGNP